MEKKELKLSELDKVAGGLTCNHTLDWCGQSGAKGSDGCYYQYNAWICKKCNILRFTKKNMETKKTEFVSPEEFFAIGGTIIF